MSYNFYWRRNMDQLIAMIVAVRQALDYESTWRAVGVVVIGFLFQAYILF